MTVTVNVPKNYSLDLSTGGGNINTDDIGGPETVLTSGGNIVAGNIGGAARLVTGGGHITVNNVSGGLFANTGGGHITTGAVTGGAILRTSGGHIRMASESGRRIVPVRQRDAVCWPIVYSGSFHRSFLDRFSGWRGESVKQQSARICDGLACPRTIATISCVAEAFGWACCSC